MKRSAGIIILLLSFLFSNVKAQSITVTGKITDEQGTPLSKATIFQKSNNKVVAVTDDNGLFTANVPAGTILKVTYIGYSDLELTASSVSNGVLKRGNDQNLNEVVVVAYGTQKKVNLTGSVATVSGAKVADKPFTSVDKALQGNVPGLQSVSSSGAPGSSTDIIIRGIGSISANSGPLWVIDGVIATTGDLTTNTTTANILSSINPDDIESISVLKDAASSSVYGSRAANGVILVTTKKGKAGKTNITASAEAGGIDRAFDPDNKPLTTSQTQTLFREAIINAGYATNNSEADQVIADNFDFNPNVNTDWIDVVTHAASQQQYNLSLSGGNETTQFYASGGYFNQQGTTIATYFKRYNGNLSVVHKAWDNRFTLTAGINGSSSIQKTPSNGGAFANPVLGAYFLPPWYKPYNPDGSPRYGDTTEFTINGGTFNPVAIAALDNATAKQTTFRGYVSGELKIINNLSISSRYSAEYFDVQEDQYRNPFYGDGQAQGGDGFSSYHRVFDWTWTNLLNYRLDFNKSKDFYLTLQAGEESQKIKIYLLQAGGQGFPATLQLQTLASAATPTTANALPQAGGTTSYLGIGGLNFKDKYILSGSFRRDGSSVFGKNNKWGNFYSIGGSWNISEEDFFKSITILPVLKLRSSYGTNGNALGFGYYAPLATYAYDANYGGFPGSRPNNVGNPDLTWEKNTVFNIGLDFSVWKNRISGSIDYYDRRTHALLLAVPLSLTSGFTTQLQNVGSISNKGIEFNLNATLVSIKDFTWNLSFNISHNKNKVTQLYLDRPIRVIPFNYTVGYDFQTFYLRQWAGVDTKNGDPLWYTDSTYTETTNNYAAAPRQLHYSAAPKVFGSLTNSFTYKGISLEVQFYYNFGNYVYDNWASYLESEGAYLGSYNQYSIELDRWQKKGDKTDIPKIIYGGNNISYASTTRYLYKGDYVRLRNLQLSYSIPQNILSKVHLQNATIYFRGTNLLTSVKSDNIPFDPEQGINGIGNLEVFVPRTITGGIKIGL